MPQPKTLEELLAEPCLHCALAEFILQWGEAHPEPSVNDILFRVIETLADFIAEAPDREQRVWAVMRASEFAVEKFRALLDGTYKADQIPPSPNAPTSQGRH